MKKMFMLFVILLFIAIGCENKYTKLDFPNKPFELKDCVFLELQNTAGNSITVVRCQNSSTTTKYQSGKIQKYVIVTEE